MSKNFQFIVNHCARLYGQERRFESLPDGIVLGRSDLILQFDAKAYSSGYSISADDIKRFASYITEFNRKYESYLGRIYSFLIVSSKFNQKPSTLQKKCQELYSKCHTPIATISSTALGDIVRLLQKNSAYRSFIDWKIVFSNVIITKSIVETQLRVLKRDKVLGAK